ncbi:MAG: 2-amino-4-hydroxy-6-hydroxymethyldihydropteridine diphosphokinase [Pseudomonadota bacterium]
MSQDRHKTVISRKLPQIRSTALVAVGSNMQSAVGDPTETLKYSINMLGRLEWVIRAVSPFYRTKAFPEGSGPDFVNAAIRAEVSGTPQQLIEQLHQIETDVGRDRIKRWSARTLDMDLLALGDVVLPDPVTQRSWMKMPLEEQMTKAPDTLILPHPRLQERAFVLVPLNDVAPGWAHPVLGKTVAEMLDRLNPQDRAEVRLAKAG